MPVKPVCSPGALSVPWGAAGGGCVLWGTFLWLCPRFRNCKLPVLLQAALHVGFQPACPGAVGLSRWAEGAVGLPLVCELLPVNCTKPALLLIPLFQKPQAWRGSRQQSTRKFAARCLGNPWTGGFRAACDGFRAACVQQQGAGTLKSAGGAARAGASLGMWQKSLCGSP